MIPFLLVLLQDWPGFLGAGRDGVVDPKGLSEDWKARPPKIAWSVSIGPGFSSMAVVGNRLFTLANQGKREAVVCIDAATGKTLWTREVADRYEDRQGQGVGPRSTPSVRDGRLYALFPRGELVCLEAHTGKPLWQVPIGVPDRTGEMKYWGLSQSPLLEGDKVIVQPGAPDGSLAAFHADTGKRLWGVGRDPVGYGSPIAVTVGERRIVIAPTGQSILGVNPADGALLFRYGFGNRYDCNCATPVWTGKALFVSAAYGTGCALLEPAGARVRELWKNDDLQNHFSNSAVVEGRLFGSHGDLGAQTFRCVDAATGRLLWADRKAGRAWVLTAGERLLCLTERGALLRVKPDPKQLVVEGEFDTSLTYKVWAAPAVAGGRLYARDGDTLTCVDLRSAN